jgi:glycosyltransferase involved in cell wall biosynthesis
VSTEPRRGGGGHRRTADHREADRDRPAYNEERIISRLLDELRRLDPELEVVVVSDGSTDRTADLAAAAGAHVVRLPFNVGIGGAVQTGFRYAWEGGYQLAVRLDGDGQHDPAQLPAVIAPVAAGEADIAIGSRFIGEGGYRSSAARRVGIRVLAWAVSSITHQRLTDTTSGFQALNRRAIALYARPAARLPGGGGDRDGDPAQAPRARGAGDDA